MGKKARKIKEKLKQAVASGPRVTNATIGGPRAGTTVDLETLGGELIICAQHPPTGTRCTLKELVDGSAAGVVLFTYERAGRPDSEAQACAFRDAYTRLLSNGLTVCGLTSDAPNANVTLKIMNRLPFALLTDPAGKLITAMGFRKQPKGVMRGVFVMDKAGNVLASETGEPADMVKVVDNLIGDVAGQHNVAAQATHVGQSLGIEHKRTDSAVEPAVPATGIPSQTAQPAPVEHVQAVESRPGTEAGSTIEPVSALESLSPSKTSTTMGPGMTTEPPVPPTTMGASVVSSNIVPLAPSA